MKMAVDQPGPSYWDGAAPPSSVLGVGAKVPSALFGVGSLAALGKTIYLYVLQAILAAHLTLNTMIQLGVGLYCIGESNVFHQLSETTVNPNYIIGAQLVPISWGMHVAAWIQKQNKK